MQQEVLYISCYFSFTSCGHQESNQQQQKKNYTWMKEVQICGNILGTSARYIIKIFQYLEQF